MLPPHQQAVTPALHQSTLLGAPLQRYLPRNVNIIGYARSKMTDQQLKERVKQFLKGDQKVTEAFLDKLSYCSGGQLRARKKPCACGCVRAKDSQTLR